MNLEEYIDYKNDKDKEYEEKNNFEEDEDTMMEEIEKKLIKSKKYAKGINQLNIQKILNFKNYILYLNFKSI